jgi:diguanylate cyclase (GGDEF)-like protein
MFKKLSIRKKLVFAILLGCLFPYVLGGFYIKGTTEEWLYNNNLENSSRNLLQTAKHVDQTILENMKNLVSMVAMEQNVLNDTKDINSYISYNPETFIKKSSDREVFITRYFETIKETHPNVNLVAFGTEDGGYIEVPTFKPTASYDPRLRPWYMNSIIEDEVVVSEPYTTTVTNELVFAVTKSVLKDGKRLGVVSLTIKLESLMAEINAMKNEQTGYINILSSKNVFINSPYKEEWVLKTIDEVDIEAFKNFEAHDGNYFEGEIDGIERVFNVYVSPESGWKYISVIDKSVILEQSGILNFLIFSIYFITFLIIFIIVLIISNYITKPILEIAHVINQMATFKFDKFENKSFEKYTHQKDEIGEITRALDTMQDNFGELESNMIKMDEQIKTVDIDGPKAYQLVLSENNPFLKISSSVNDLLLKVHNSIAEVRKANDEITYKNNLLVNKEEVLTTKLEEIETQKEYIRYLADHDPLTNLPNRRKFREILKSVIERADKGTVVLLDLDNFKGINDTLGHIFGDKVLQHISQKIQEFIIGNVFVSRFGGDEFLLLFEGENSHEDTISYIQRLQDHFDNIFSIDHHDIKIEFSVGVSVFPDDSKDINELIMYADLALYTIKNSGKNNYSFFNQEMAEHLKFKQSTKEILRAAIINDGFKVLYQPIVDIKTGEIISFEALLRIKEHDISPNIFIEIAEEEGLIITIGRIVTKKVVEQLARWKNAGMLLKPVSINFSAVQIHDHLYKDFLFELLRINEIDPRLIIIELTENIFLEKTDYTIELMKSLRENDIQIAIDDFGTGYSSLFYLTYLPIDYVKLDRELCLKFLELENISVMDSLISLIHSLNLKVIAEGIEDYEHVRRLIVGKCDAVQGYYFSLPIEAEEVFLRGNEYYDI